MVPLSLWGLRALFLLALNNISLSGCTGWPSPAEGRLGGFQVLAVRNEAACSKYLCASVWASSFNSVKLKSVATVREGKKWLSFGRNRHSARCRVGFCLPPQGVGVPWVLQPRQHWVWSALWVAASDGREVVSGCFSLRCPEDPGCGGPSPVPVLHWGVQIPWPIF